MSDDGLKVKIVDASSMCLAFGSEEGCAGDVDGRYSLPGGIRWCSACGPAAAERQEIIRRLLDAGHGRALEAALNEVVGRA